MCRYFTLCKFICNLIIYIGHLTDHHIYSYENVLCFMFYRDWLGYHSIMCRSGNASQPYTRCHWKTCTWMEWQVLLCIIVLTSQQSKVISPSLNLILHFTGCNVQLPAFQCNHGMRLEGAGYPLCASIGFSCPFKCVN